MKKDFKSNMEYIGNGDLRVHHAQDVTQLLEDNKMLREQNQTGKDMKLAARIPMNLLFIWQQEGLVLEQVGIDPEMTGLFWKKLQDPQYAKFRVWEGRMV